MPDVTLNYWAILVAVLASMFLGYIWYARWFLGAMWMKLVGLNEESAKKGAGPAMFGMLVTAFVMNYVLAHFVDYTTAETVSEGMMTGAWLWLGFVATAMISDVFFAKRPLHLFLINAGYQLVNLLVGGAILAAWV